MNPNESHELGDYFLTSFLKKIVFKASELGIDGPSIVDIDSWNLDEAEVLREWRNIDILVKVDKERFVCVIENKIQSGEHSKQLRRYKNMIQKEYANYKKSFVYLTVEGDPSESEYIPMKYSEIDSIIEQLIDIKKNKLGTEVLTFIIHYREMLRRYIMEDSRIQEMCRKIYKQHKTALNLIFRYSDRRSDIKECLVKIIEKDPDLVLDDCTKSYIRFIPENLDIVPKRGKGWTKTRRMLLFEFNNNPKGLDLHLIIGPGPKEIREKLYGIARGNLGLFNRSNRRLFSTWFRIYTKAILRLEEYEDKEVGEIKKLLEGKIMKFKISDLPKIENEIKKFGMSQTLSAR